jgi:general secretion pathway protein A
VLSTPEQITPDISGKKFPGQKPMYNEFYQLKENPFNMTADPGFYFSSSRHSEAFSHLIYGIQNRKGILVITGEIGTGKTTLCRTFLNRLESGVKTALILNPDFSEIQLLRLIVQDLEIHGEFKNKLSLINALNEYLLEQAKQGNNVVIIIDEAQNLKPRQLEQIRLLSNLETEKEKLLQIILVGQPELLDMLKLNSLRQLTQRIAVKYHILPLDKAEIKGYIYHRIQIASQNSGNTILQFTDEAIDAIYLFSKGIPRVINIICDRALLAGFTEEKHSIDAEIISKCAREVNQ